MWQCGNWGNGAIGALGRLEQWGNGAIGQWGNGAMGHWGNGAMGQWGNWGNGSIGAMVTYSRISTISPLHLTAEAASAIAMVSASVEAAHSRRT